MVMLFSYSQNKREVARLKVNDVRVGDVFNNLEILELLGYDKWRKNRLARCKCKCGKESITQISKLISGHTKSCGKCNRVEVGDKIGKWIVVSEAEKHIGHNRMMECICECGNTSTVAATVLGRGRSKSCGKCTRAEIGEIYGELEVIAEGGKDSSNRRKVKCVCSCGKETIVDSYNLTSGTTKTCGKCNETTYRVEGKISYGILPDDTEFSFDSLKLNLVETHQWHSDADGYIKTSKESGKGNQLLHRILINAPNNKVVDHIDGNPRNNTIENLRVCTRQENVFNQKLSKANTSGYTGVYQLKNGKYVACIGFNKKKIYLGRYQYINDAAMVRNEAAKLLFGEFARLNDSPEAPDHIKKYVYDKCKGHIISQNQIAI